MARRSSHEKNAKGRCKKKKKIQGRQSRRGFSSVQELQERDYQGKITQPEYVFPLKAGDAAKSLVRFRGREMAHQENWY